jgi:hypothetical protein
VNIATVYGLDGWGSIPGRGKILFSASQRPASINLPTKLVPGALSPWSKADCRESYHSHPSNIEIENGGAIPPVPHTFLLRGA